MPMKSTSFVNFVQLYALMIYIKFSSSEVFQLCCWKTLILLVNINLNVGHINHLHKLGQVSWPDTWYEVSSSLTFQFTKKRFKSFLYFRSLKPWMWIKVNQITKLCGHLCPDTIYKVFKFLSLFGWWYTT